MSDGRHLAWWVMTLIASSGCVARCGEASQATAAVPWDRIRSTDARQRGRELYLHYCVLCHGEHADGRGVRSMGLDRQPADFTNQAWGDAGAPLRVYRAIHDGVPGTPMPSWSALSDAEIWDLVSFVVSVNTQGA